MFDIQRFSIHDGPGIRTTVFLKGCPLRCKWCCNPESASPNPVLLYNAELCIGCGACVDVCPSGASSKSGFDREKCAGCGKCAEVCYAEAKYLKGRYMTPRDVLTEVLKDKTFYNRTGGGATFSGGEPLIQIDFLEAVLRLCKENGLNTAVETCASVPWENFERAAGLVDVFLFDIKSLDSDMHLAYTGAGNERIMENARHLAPIARRMIIRVPVIPKFNFNRASLEAILRFAEEIGVGEVNFLPYHRFAAAKYGFLGKEYWNPGVERLTEDEVKQCVEGVKTSVIWRIGG